MVYFLVHLNWKKKSWLINNKQNYLIYVYKFMTIYKAAFIDFKKKSRMCILFYYYLYISCLFIICLYQYEKLSISCTWSWHLCPRPWVRFPRYFFHSIRKIVICIQKFIVINILKRNWDKCHKLQEDSMF